MSQKIWVIDDNYEEQAAADDTVREGTSQDQRKSARRTNPSLAYSLSILVWGGGQFYNGQWRLGTLFLLFMMNFYLLLGIGVMYWEPITSFFGAINVNSSGTLLMFGFIYLSGLIVWYFSAWQAYFRSIQRGAKIPKGAATTLLPAVCSLLIPGWGQLLNGQIKKGLLFQLFTFTGLAALPFTFLAFLLWPTLEASRSRFLLEWISSAGVILSPFIIVMWIISVFDAAKVSMNVTKKEPLPTKIRYAVNRFRHNIQIYGWKNALLPLIKRTALVMLLLIFCSINFKYIPREFYMQELQNLGGRMSQQEMTVIPGLISKLLNRIGADDVD